MIKFAGVKLYSVQDAAKTLHLKPQTIYSYIWAGKLAVRKIGNRTYISEEELERFVNSSEERRKGVRQ